MELAANECLHHLLHRTVSQRQKQFVPSWTAFNEIVTGYEPDITGVGFLPMIPTSHVRHDVCTAMTKDFYISHQAGQTHVVLTYYKAMSCI